MHGSSIRFEERLHLAGTFADVALAIIEEVQSAIGASAVNVFPLCLGRMPEARAVHASEHMAGDQMLLDAIRILPQTKRDFGDLSRVFRMPDQTMDLTETFGLSRIEKTASYRRFWAPYRLERQVITLMGTESHPLGFVCMGGAPSPTVFERGCSEARHNLSRRRAMD